MSLHDEKKLVLEMVSESKITVEEAEELLDALEDSLCKDHQSTFHGDIDLVGDLFGDTFDIEFGLDDLDSKLDDLDATLENLEADLDDIEAEFEI